MKLDITYFGLVEWLGLAFGVYILSALRINKRVLYNNGVRDHTEIGAWLAVLILLLLASMRSGIGDTGAYIRYYQMVSADSEVFFSTFTRTGEWGFQLLMFFCKKIFGGNISVYLLFFAIFSVGCICVFLIRYSGMTEMALFLYLASGLFITNLNGMRQSFVTGIFVAATGLIIKKKYIIFIILCLALSTIHSSALILIPAVWIFNFKPWGKGTKALLFVGLILYAFYPLFAPVLSSLMTSNDQYSVYSTGIMGGKGDLGANFVRAIIKFVPIGLAYFEREKLKMKEHFSIFLHASILDFVFMLLATAKSWIFARICIYLAPFSIVLLCWGIGVANKKNRLVLYFGCLVGYSVFYIYELLSSVL